MSERLARTLCAIAAVVIAVCAIVALVIIPKTGTAPTPVVATGAPEGRMEPLHPVEGRIGSWAKAGCPEMSITQVVQANGVLKMTAGASYEPEIEVIASFGPDGLTDSITIKTPGRDIFQVIPVTFVHSDITGDGGLKDHWGYWRYTLEDFSEWMMVRGVPDGFGATELFMVCTGP